MSATLGAGLVALAGRTDPSNPTPDNVVTIVLHVAGAYGSPRFAGILDPTTTTDLAVLQPGRLVEQWGDNGEEMPPAWRPSGLPVWIPIESILYVTPGDAS